jgi:hypothetical protein
MELENVASNTENLTTENEFRNPSQVAETGLHEDFSWQNINEAGSVITDDFFQLKAGIRPN